MSKQGTEILTPVGRLVSGHPMELNAVTDEKTKQPKIGKDGSPQMKTYVGLAIPKGTEPHWNQTEWGAAIWNVAAAGWPNGEFNAPAFAWKITDGDSKVPNKKGRIPCEREGWTGHWVIHASQGWPVKCFHSNRFEAHQVIQRKEEIKPGDYVRLIINAKDNAPSESPGVYLNPSLLEVVRAGIEIVLTAEVDASAAFGGVAAQLPTGAMVDPNAQAPAAVPATPTAAAAPVAAPVAAVPSVSPQPQPAPAAAPAVPAPGVAVTPAPDFLKPQAALAPPPPPVAKTYLVEGTYYTEEDLKGFKWTDEQIAALG